MKHVGLLPQVQLSGTYDGAGYTLTSAIPIKNDAQNNIGSKYYPLIQVIL